MTSTISTASKVLKIRPPVSSMSPRDEYRETSGGGGGHARFCFCFCSPLIAIAFAALSTAIIFNLHLHQRLGEVEQRFSKRFLKSYPGKILKTDSNLISSDQEKDHARHTTASASASPVFPVPVSPHPDSSIAESKADVLDVSKPQQAKCEIKHGVDYFGSDITGVPATDIGECCNLCQQNSLCGAFSYVMADKSCWLKRPEAVLHASDKAGVDSGSLPSRRPPPPKPPPKKLGDPSVLAESGKIPVVVITYNRGEYLKRTLRSIINAIPAEHVSDFDIIVSQQGNDPGVTNAVNDFKSKLRSHLHFKYHDNGERQKGYEASNWLNYYKMTSHYGFAFRSAFALDPTYDHLIIMEDDLEVAPDFFEFFTMAAYVLNRDDSLYCASAWNDNGMSQLVKELDSVRRTDVFPGLGWMLPRRVWEEIEGDHTWPLAFWDEAMREPQIRKGRSCLIPEVNRAYTFGSHGNSQAGGNWWRRFLEPIRLAERPIAWTAKAASLSVGGKAAYDSRLSKAIRDAEEHSIDEAVAADGSGGGEGTVDWLVQFSSEADFVNKAGRFGLLNEYKEGRPRASYCGVITIWAPCGKRVLFAHRKTVVWARSDDGSQCEGSQRLP